MPSWLSWGCVGTDALRSMLGRAVAGPSKARVARIGRLRPPFWSQVRLDRYSEAAAQ